MPNMTCGFIGLGLIGGSIAKAVKKFYPDTTIIAYDVNKKALDLARRENIVDIAVWNIDERFSPCDYIFLCAPVQYNAENLLAVREIISEKCILTDVGSVKTTIHESVRNIGLEHCFIGGHPMAGSERVGFANSKAELLENAYYVLTPAPSVTREKIDRFQQIIAGLRAIPLILNCGQHDYVTAAISHLPHVAASCLVNLIRESDSEDGIMRMVAAGGFKDITRIASSSAIMWQQICLTNSENISSMLSNYIRSLTEFKDVIDSRNSEALYQFFDSARIYRDSFANVSSGPIKRSYSVNIDIADRAGALAHIVTLLADRGLSIKNIAISHNRESEDGVLRVEFYQEGSMIEGVQVLKNAGYIVHTRD